MSYRYRKAWVVVAVLSLGSISHAVWANPELDCPDGFEPIPSGLACAAVNEAGSTETGSFITPLPPPGRNCPEGFEKPRGVNFCVATWLTLNASGSSLILERQTSRLCPEGFHRPIGSRICVASNLTLQATASGVQLFGPTTDCPIGFARPAGSTHCVATSFVATPANPPCPPGFVRPPGVVVCIAANLVYGSASASINPPPPLGCPENWVKPDGVRFCIPAYEKASESATLARRFTAKLCPAGTTEVWYDMPIYDASGLFVIDTVPTRMCVVEVGPAG